MSVSKISVFLRDDTGSNAIEYALIAVLIAVAAVAAVIAVGTNLLGSYQTICDSVANAAGNAC